MHVTIGSPVGEAMYEPWITMKSKDYLLISGKHFIIVRITEAMWMLCTGL